ncbi:hypothetical protein JRO89_XS10G0005300 [Xanthoceras sorbifolium]|uniref:Gibberellic acid methyltransferase 2 n=1 Tax=Xanthoceras sorbifolium TaxID=99658 RepID=A0ABQ8HH66_9ROSI|nr:hypothetical protein JRO89_XS10G0005300 [Xanthoceras sorbifolium]
MESLTSIQASRREKIELQTWINGSLQRVLCMQGGDDDGSYAKNSQAPASAITLSKPLLLNAINQSMKLFFKTKEEQEKAEHSISLRIADLGCATGYNTLATIDMVVETVRLRYLKECGLEPEFEVFFSDLPSNDFNSLFRSLSSSVFSDHNTDVSKTRQYYAAGVPGSFYHRLFPKGKLHIAVSLSALHWLSKIPDGVLDKRSAAWNKGRAWIEGAKKEVVEAYAKQAERDLEDFLSCRKEEIATGGVLFILMGGRPESQPAENQLEEETRDMFNIPAYMRSIEEVERGIKRCGGFEIERIEYKRIVEHSEEKQKEWMRDPVSYGRAKANLVRATLKPIVQAHLGPYLSDQLFNRFESRVSSDFNLLHKTCFYGVIVLSAIRI